MVAYTYTKSTFIGSGDELLNVTELDCSGCRITFFEGLRAPLLTRLDCRHNKLASFKHLHAPNNYKTFSNELLKKHNVRNIHRTNKSFLPNEYYGIGIMRCPKINVNFIGIANIHDIVTKEYT